MLHYKLQTRRQKKGKLTFIFFSDDSEQYNAHQQVNEGSDLGHDNELMGAAVAYNARQEVQGTY